MGKGKNQTALQPRDITENTCNSDDRKQREWGQKKIDPGRGREIQGIFFKEDSQKESSHGSWGRQKGLGDPCDLSNRRPKAASLQLPLGRPEPRNTFRNTNVKGESGTLLSCPRAALPGLAGSPAPDGRGRRTDGQPPGTAVGIPVPTATEQTEEVFCLWRIF